MSVRAEVKFMRYVKKASLSDPPDQILKELEENAKKLSLKGTELKLFAEDFITGRSTNIHCSPINCSIIPYHNHDFYEINYCLDGQCAQYIEGKRLIMKKGDFLLLPTEAFHASCSVGDSKCINILIRAEWLKSLEERFRKYDRNNFLSLLINNKVYMLFNDISDTKAALSIRVLMQQLKKNSNYAPYDDIYVESLASKLMVELSVCDRLDTTVSLNSHNVGVENPEVICQYIRDNISSVTLDSASAHFGYTGAHLSRLIKKYTGNSFSMFLKTQRILKAESLLVKTDLPTSDIAEHLGLDSKEYFCRMFKRVNGIAPSVYRKRFKNVL